MWNKSIAFAQEVAPGAAESAAPQGSPFISTIVFMLIIFGIMWVFLILPNQRREKERRQLLGSLAKGDRVVTNGGICGTIVGLNDKTVVLKVSDDPTTKIEFIRGAVSQVSQRASESKD